jgi:hypothetical protein
MDRIKSKIDSIERIIQINGEEIIDKLIKYDERDAVFESRVTSHITNLEQLVKHSLDALTNIKEIGSKNFNVMEKLVNTIRDNSHHQNQLMGSQINLIITQIQVLFMKSFIQKQKQ